MKKNTQPPPRTGSTPDEIFRAVGSALSWWEGAEDVLMGVFRWMCERSEPTAFAAYVGSPRGRRAEMFRDALDRYQRLFTEDELQTIRGAIKELDKLAPIRNEIAHGHCSGFTQNIGDKQTMSGSYLLPSLNEGRWHERNPRYAHTAETIVDFESRVRQHRWTILDAHGAAMMRRQGDRGSAGAELDMVVQVARHIDQGLISASEAQDALNHIMAMQLSPPANPSGI